MIFLRSTLREFTAAGIGVFIVLLAITFTTQLIRLLGFAARGGVPPDAVLTLLGFSALGYLSVLLSATLFLSVLLSMTRAYRDSEMVVWHSAGLALASWFKPVLLFATPIVLIVAGLSLYLTPWAIGKTEQFRQQLENRDDVSAVSPGVFKESKNADRVYFVEKLSTDLTQVANIFVQDTRNGRMVVAVASRGYVETAENGDRYLVAVNGRQYDGTAGQADYRVVNFARYSVRIEQGEVKAFFPSEKSRSTRELLENPTPINRAELTWRVGVPVSALILSMLAVPLSAVNPRTGRFVNVIVAVLVFMIYSNLVSIVQAWVAQQKVGTIVGMWGVHVAMLLLLGVLLARRYGMFRRLLPRKAVAPSAGVQPGAQS